MAGNRSHFNNAMQNANEAVWAEHWEDAADAYQRALKEFPNNASALLGYAWTLLNVHDLDNALDAYQKITKITPEDPGPYERIGDIYKTQGQREQAISAFLEAGKRYAKQELYAKQIASLEAAIELSPQQPDIWAELIELYKEQHLIDQAVLASLWVCYLWQDTEKERAINTLRTMQQFIPHNSQIQRTLHNLQRNQPLPIPPQLGAVDQLHMMETGLRMDDAENGTNAIDAARQYAMEQLAEAIFDEDLPPASGIQDDEVRLLISKAVNAQTNGDVDTARHIFERLLDSGIELPAIQYGLGLIYLEQSNYEEAISQFYHAGEVDAYVVACHIGIGQCNVALGRDSEALRSYIYAVHTMDMQLVNPDDSEELGLIYEELIPFLCTSDNVASSQLIVSRLAEYFNAGDWQIRMEDARRRLDELAKLGTVFNLVELLILTERDNVLRGMAISQEYVRRGHARSAIEETMHTISLEPSYLPPHHLLAELLLETNQLDESLRKYEMLARTYEIRTQIPQAIATYKKIIEISPLDIPVEERVAELEIKRGNFDEALKHYLQIAEAHYQLAQPDIARQTYVEARKYASRGSQDKRWEMRILHKMADLDIQRLDWMAAINDYEEILKLDTNDERAHLALYKLYPRTGRDYLAINILDKLIKSYLENRKITPVLAILEDLILEEPDSIALRARIAQLYLNTGKGNRALEHLDVLGDLQLNAGHKDGAIKTLEAILRLGPDNYDDYAELYRSIANKEPPRPKT